MRKIIVLVILTVMFSGCQNTQPANIEDLQYSEYEDYIKRLDSQEVFNENTDEFDVKVIMNETNKNDYRYDIIVDNPKREIHHIKAIAQIPVAEGFSYPSIGILEDESFSLIPNVIDKDNNIYKGINLSAISPYQEITIYVYVTFYSSVDSNGERIERYMEVTNNAS